MLRRRSKDAVRSDLRRLAGELLIRAKAIPSYRLLLRLRLTVPMEAIEEAHCKLLKLGML
jgi:hypothetical protein